MWMPGQGTVEAARLLSFASRQSGLLDAPLLHFTGRWPSPSSCTLSSTTAPPQFRVFQSSPKSGKRGTKLTCDSGLPSAVMNDLPDRLSKYGDTAYPAGPREPEKPPPAQQGRAAGATARQPQACVPWRHASQRLSLGPQPSPPRPGLARIRAEAGGTAQPRPTRQLFRGQGGQRPEVPAVSPRGPSLVCQRRQGALRSSCAEPAGLPSPVTCRLITRPGT